MRRTRDTHATRTNSLRTGGQPVQGPPYTPMPPGTIRDPEAVENESAPDSASDDEQYW